MTIKKLIEVALPLEKINAECAKEKTAHSGHPSTLHLYWARRPLAATRAVIWASLVDDPSSHPELFPTENEQNKERQRLFGILEKLVKWENVKNENILDIAKAEITRYVNVENLTLLDPFAGGGAIPIEAQRLGLRAIAHDLNPIAVMINKAMIEIPYKYSNLNPVNKESCRKLDFKKKWRGAEGLAEDVLFYGNLMKKIAFDRIGDLFPKINTHGAQNLTVIAWQWARTVKCPNPACGVNAPLVSSFILSTKNDVWINPIYENGKYRFEIRKGNCSSKAAFGTKFNSNGKVKKGTFSCPHCSSGIITSEYVDQEANKGRMSVIPLAIVAEGAGKRTYLPFDEKLAEELHCKIDTYYEKNNISAMVSHEKTRGTFASNAQGGYYGFVEFKDYFTKRQQIALATFSSLIKEIKKQVEQDIQSKTQEEQICYCDYATAVCTYLAFAVDKLADYNSSVCSWLSARDGVRNTFGRQAIPMVWDYTEANPFSNSSGCWDNMLDWVYKAILKFPLSTSNSIAEQFDAQVDCGLRNVVVSTDPPYYNNMAYADLSDFFYVWMRSSLQPFYPDLFKTLLTPKTEELIANPYRFEGSSVKAKNFFEQGMSTACKRIYLYAKEEIPVTIYYAFKQSETEKMGEKVKVSSSGWETMLNAIVNAGFVITGTWPMQTEMESRTVANKKNALASSIVLVCRKRPADAPITTRHKFIKELKSELKTSLQKLQSSNIAPVDMAQSAIGPGMGVFSKYAQVLEADGTSMSVRSALQIINQELDLYFNEQDGELDSNSRFCVEFYTQYGFNDAKFGDADTLARAKNTSVATLQSKGVFFAEKGVAHLLDRDMLPEKIDYSDNMVWLFTQHLTHAMSTGGIKACASIIQNVRTALPEQAKALAYRLHSIAERRNWQEEAFAYNSLVIAWSDIQMEVSRMKTELTDEQYKLDI